MKKITLSCSQCNNKNYSVSNSAMSRLKINKFCKKCNMHQIHKEDK
ncbi:MAG: 50S ribosomal protein L33 [Metamycoplasmataceae bacterium]